MTDAFTLQSPHGPFAMHTREGVIGPDGQPALYVICACGRGYAFGHYADSERLATWLLDHNADIPCPHRPSMQVGGKCYDCGSEVAASDPGCVVSFSNAGPTAGTFRNVPHPTLPGVVVPVPDGGLGVWIGPPPDDDETVEW